MSIFTNQTISVSPDTISGLIGWWKADALSLNNGDPVDTWADSSSSRNDATQTGDNSPTYVTNVINNLPVVRFTGAFNVTATSDFLSITSVTTMRHYFVVIKWTGTNNLGSVMGKSAAPIKYYGGASNGGVNELIIHQTFSYSQVVNGTAYNNGTLLANTAALYRDYNQFQLYECTTTISTLDWDRIGGITSGANNYYINADVAEIVIFDGILSTANRLLVQNYLSRKYNIPTGTGYTPMTNVAKT